MPLKRPNFHRATTLLVTAAIATGSIASTAPAIASAAPSVARPRSICSFLGPGKRPKTPIRPSRPECSSQSPTASRTSMQCSTDLHVAVHG